ncbi:MIP18 family-like domain-containing protein [Plasmodiophora brassicae]|uniref:MIP18 family-like domain-containing protein n=1 Tax=Plasmodiophora brassicae TaxID=37360 RepID=A0A0G4IRP8_PLABS|nr:hypothetical protein PBRA_005938 [Plasmodiophora brassicae]SPQ98374.1 unnamed protein product [Plasmodiophora brassicae]
MSLNANPVVFGDGHRRVERAVTDPGFVEDCRDPIDAEEIFDLIRDINDPEHPLTLEQLNVARREDISVDDGRGYVRVCFTPTIPHCSMATLIGLSVRVQLLRSLPRRFKIDVYIAAGTHASETAINKQLNDKERVMAALENPHLLDVVNKCLAGPSHNT